VQRLLGGVLGAWMRFVGATTRWQVINAATADNLARNGPVIVCFWHGRIMLVHTGWMRASRRWLRTHMLISQSREGSVIAHAAEALGLSTVRGSTETKADKNKGALEATRAMLRRLKEGAAVAITPDGPKGPRMRAEMGSIQLARLSGAPLLCLAWSTSDGRALNSWDRFLLARPFGRGAYVFGNPISVDRRADDAAMETARLALETELTRITQEADRLVGMAPVEPAEARDRPLREVSAA
jgi:lysophospholipid acyltransferase (LPLAT)-like uncharacterized protein